MELAADVRGVVRWVVEPCPHHAPLVEDLVLRLREESSGATSHPLGRWRRIRASAQRRVFRSQLGEQRLFGKLYLPRTTWRLSRLPLAFRSPAARAVHWFGVLRRIGVPTATVVAAGELRPRRSLLSGTDSFVVTSSSAHHVTLRDLLRGGLLPRGRRAALADRLRAVLGRLHAADLGSFELRAENVLVDRRDDRVLLFDVDRTGRMLLPHKRRRVFRRDRAVVEATCAALLAGVAPGPETGPRRPGAARPTALATQATPSAGDAA